MLFPPQDFSLTVGANFPVSFPAERITESILALSDMTVLLTQNSCGVAYCSKSVFTVLGLTQDEIMNGGWPRLYQCIHPQDQHTLDKKLLPALFAFLKRIEPAERNNYTFNYTLRMQHAKGHYLLIAIENQPMEWRHGKWPQLYMSVLKNITPFGNSHSMVLTIAKREENKRYVTVHRQEFNFRWDPFTPREVEIIRMITNGLTSRQMASCLNISPETVRNHRKKILHKSGCSSSSELSAFAHRERML